MHRLESRIRYAWILSALLLSGAVGVMAGMAVFILLRSSGTGVAVGLPLFLFLSVLGAVYAHIRYKRWRFELREDYLYLEHGVFTKVHSMVPYVRVQHIDTERSVLDRLLGLSSLVVYTAGSRGADVHIPGLSPADAESIQKTLRDIAIETDDIYGDAV